MITTLALAATLASWQVDTSQCVAATSITFQKTTGTVAYTEAFGGNSYMMVNIPQWGVPPMGRADVKIYVGNRQVGDAVLLRVTSERLVFSIKNKVSFVHELGAGGILSFRTSGNINVVSVNLGPFTQAASRVSACVNGMSV